MYLRNVLSAPEQAIGRLRVASTWILIRTTYREDGGKAIRLVYFLLPHRGKVQEPESFHEHNLRWTYFQSFSCWMPTM